MSGEYDGIPPSRTHKHVSSRYSEQFEISCLRSLDDNSFHEKELVDEMVADVVVARSMEVAGVCNPGGETVVVESIPAERTVVDIVVEAA